MKICLLDAAVLFVICLGISVATSEPNVSVKKFTVNEGSMQIDAREGCEEVFTCSGRSKNVPTWRKLGDGAPLSVEPVVSNTPSGEDGMQYWQSSLVFSSLKTTDRGLLVCDVESRALGFALRVFEGIAVMDPIANVSLSSDNVGEIISISCRVDTCLTDVVVQFFRGSELLDSSTSAVERGWQGTIELRASEKIVGEYVCQAMSDNANQVFRQSFSVVDNL